MSLKSMLYGASFLVAGAAAAQAAIVNVPATAGPWSIGANPTLVYSNENPLPVSLTLATGATQVTITYLSGATSEFLGAPPLVDALGYVGGVFGSGDGSGFGVTLTGIGSSGKPFPSGIFGPLTTGAPVWLGALVGAFTDDAGVLVGSGFATGNGPFTIAIPTGATHLALGLNDDIFADNSGALRIDVSGVTSVAGVPEPGSWALMLLGFAGLGLAGLRRVRRGTA